MTSQRDGTMTERLRNCPFCGAENSETVESVYQATCVNCGATSGQFAFSESGKWWNARKTEDVLEAYIAHLKEAHKAEKDGMIAKNRRLKKKYRQALADIEWLKSRGICLCGN